MFKYIIVLLLFTSCISPRYITTEHYGVVTEYLGQLDNKVHYYYVQPLNNSLPTIGHATIYPKTVGDTIIYKIDMIRTK